MSHDRVMGAALVALVLTALPPTGRAETVKPEPAPHTLPGNPTAVPPEKVAPPLGSHEDYSGSQDSGSSGTSPSDRLSRSKGIIKPPANVDPGMTAPTPDPGAHSMKVVPPPGTSGGDRSIEPK